MSLPPTFTEKDNLKSVFKERKCRSEDNYNYNYEFNCTETNEFKTIAYRLKQSRKGYIGNLAKFINRAINLLEIPHNTKEVALMKEKLGFAVFKLEHITHEYSQYVTEASSEAFDDFFDNSSYYSKESKPIAWLPSQNSINTHRSINVKPLKSKSSINTKIKKPSNILPPSEKRLKEVTQPSSSHPNSVHSTKNFTERDIIIRRQLTPYKAKKAKSTSENESPERSSVSQKTQISNPNHDIPQSMDHFIDLLVERQETKLDIQRKEATATSLLQMELE